MEVNLVWSVECLLFRVYRVFVVVPGGEAEGGSKLGRAEEGDEGEGERGEEVEEIGGQGRPTKYGMFLLAL